MDFSISSGETKEVSVLLDNETQYVAFQFDLYLPTGISLAGYEVNGERVPASTEVSMAQQEDGSYRFLAAAMAMEPIVGNNGGIITLKLKASANVVTGNRSGYLRSVKLSKEDGAGQTTFEVPFTVKVLKPSIVTAKSYTREYGEENPTFEYDVKGGELEGAPEISCEATAASPVGTYPIVVKKGTVTNYSDSYVNGTLTITKAPLTITAQSCTIKQGETLPNFEVSYSGFKNNETEEALTKKPTITCIATSGSAVGTYDIVVSGAESGNYDIAFANGTLVIADADPVTVTAKSYTRAYGDANPTFEYTSEGKALVGTPEISCEATTVSPVGTYPIVVKKGAVTNYNDSYVNGTLTITKAPLTITAQSCTIKQGETLPNFEVSYSGFKNNETEEALTKKPTITCIATSGSAVGTYDIVVSGAESGNYEFTYVAGILTIEEAVKIVPMEEETEVVFDAIITEETDLKDVVIDNVYVTLDTDADDGYDSEEKCIVLASIVADEQLDAIKDKEVNDETVKENFNGLIFAVPAGKGVINITAKTKGNRTLNVKIGDTDPQTFVQPERGVVEIPYVSDEDTYVYVYGADVAASGKRRVASADINNGVLIYNIKWTTEELTDIDVVTTEGNDSYQIFTVDGKSVETLQKGVNIIRFFDGTTKSVYVK